jgi:vacuolar protein sorting-associated protein 53
MPVLSIREDFRGILARSGKSLDVKLLLSALQQSLEFEYYLEKRFAQTVPSIFYVADDQERESMDTVSSKGEERTLIFGKAISEAFEPYLSLYIDSQDQ